MRILHTSDWHLGRIFYGVHLTDDQAYVLDELIELIKYVKPDVIITAGDIFDRAIPTVEAVDLLDDILSRIILDIKIPVIMIAGNHDSPDRVNFGSRLMKSCNLSIRGRFKKDINPVVLSDKYGEVYFYPLPYAEPVIVRDCYNDDNIHTHDDSMKKVMDTIKENMKSHKRNVLIAHAFASGCEPSESERPLSIGGSGVVDASYFNGFSYVALGHLHRPQKVGNDNIRYSGSLMKYSFSEANQKKNIPVIDMDEDGNISIKYYDIKPQRDVRCIEGYLKDILKGPQNGENADDYIMVTLKDKGAILDAMGKIREVYPNTLHIEKKEITPAANLLGADANFKKMNIDDLFSSFYSQVTGSDLSKEEKDAFNGIISRQNDALREGQL